MKIKVTKKMVQTLNKYAKYKPFNFSYETLGKNEYAFMVDYNFWANMADYNPETGRFAFIRVSYDPELYALSQALTTRILQKIVFPGDTLEQYINRVIEYVET